jgi:hypothetical protein
VQQQIQPRQRVVRPEPPPHQGGDPRRRPALVLIAETVTAVLVHHDTDRYDLTVRTVRGTAVIDTTRSHLFWDLAGHRWVKAAALKHGTRLRTPNGTAATVAGGHDPHVTAGWMWDLTVPGNGDHAFYVLPAAGSAPVLVHNVDNPYGPAGTIS